ncbi:MAG: hypothetical protein IJ728_00705 [Selenomonadaceae bacterium]|nr:hypothetical protein [Selenomonadaceae bacterium]
MINEQDFIGFARDNATGLRKPLRHFARNPTWESDIFMHETGEAVIGGENGVDNLPLNQLANRTEYLKQQFDLNFSILSELKTQLEDFINYGKRKNTLPIAVSTSKPNSKSAWLNVDQQINDEVVLSLESGDILSLSSGSITLDTDNVAYIFQGNDSISPITLPVDTPGGGSSDETLTLDDTLSDSITDEEIDSIIDQIYSDITLVGG